MRTRLCLIAAFLVSSLGFAHADPQADARERAVAAKASLDAAIAALGQVKSRESLAAARENLHAAQTAIEAALQALSTESPSEQPGARVATDWAKPSREQRSAAAKLGVPVAIENGLGMRFILLPAGAFRMGSPEDEPRRDEDERLHRVVLSEPLYLQITEVTNRQIRAWKPTHHVNDYLNGDDQPAVNMSHTDAVEFARWASRTEGKHLYHLPTEAQWEFACRAGTETPFSFGPTISTNDADYDGDYAYPGGQKGPYLRRTTTVGSYAANPWGIFDMHGNVWEWCADWYAPYDAKAVTDPSGPPNGTGRVVRGGSWYQEPHLARSAQRRARPPTDQDIILGFRLVASVPK